MNDKDKEQILEALRVCGGYDNHKCDKCPIEWLEDHGYNCHRYLAEQALNIIEGEPITTPFSIR